MMDFQVLLYQLISEVQVQQDDVEYLFIRVVTLEALLQVLQVGNHACLIINGLKSLALLKFIQYHHLVRFFLEKNVIVVLADCCYQGVVGSGQHQLAFVIWVGEHTLGDASVVMFFFEEELCLIVGEWQNEEVEIIEDLLLLGAPIVIVEVVLNPHKALIYHLGDKGLPNLRLITGRDWQLNFKSGA